jgi:hypothetical protein
MSKLEIYERLTQMAGDATANARTEMETIGRQLAAQNMHKSGNHVKALQHRFEEIFDTSISEMADFALRTQRPREAAGAIDQVGRHLEGDLISLFAGKLLNLNMLSERALETTKTDFERGLRGKLLAVVTDARLNVVGYAPGSRGFVALCQRNAWIISLSAAGVSLASLYVAWTKP